tara:strand:- start:5023 stop:5847 length:825 start_codon:yes stop_codon:yes gene_type:complete
MNNSFRKYYSVLKMSWIQTLEYRANAVVGAFAILSGLLIEYLLLSKVFSDEIASNSAIQSFASFNHLIIYIMLCMMVGQLKSSWHNSMMMIDEIRSGELNKYLIKPISYFSYNFMNFIGHNSLFYIVYFIMMGLVPIIMGPGYAFNGLLQIIGFLLTLFISVFLSYSTYFCMICFGFWFGEVRALIISYNVFNIFLSGQLIPISLFPDGLKQFVMNSPFRYMVDFPVSIATASKFNFEYFLDGVFIQILWCIAMYLTGKMIYNLGIQQYEAFGA